MNEKDRIIELVRNNVLTMEEALQLLEAASKQKKSKDNDYAAEYKEAQIELEAELNGNQSDKATENSEQSNEKSEESFEEKFKQLNAQLDKKQTALTIAKQRLRELEIFAELDELTPEMLVQQTELKEKIEQIAVEIEELNIEIEVAKQELRHSVQDEIKRVVETTTDKVANAAKQMTKEARKEGRNIQETITKGLKEFAASFDMKDINITVPWIKSTAIQHQFSYDVSDLAQVDIHLLNGDLSVETHEENRVVIDADITFYGKEDTATVDQFEALSTIDVTKERIFFHVKTPKVTCNLKVKVPKSHIQEMRLTAVNGDLVVQGIEGTDLYVDSKNGEVALSNTHVDFVEFEGFNGDVLIKESQIADLVYHVLNGDLKYKGIVGNISADVINGNLVISKHDTGAANINVKAVSGDIKISVPESVNLEIDVNSNFGEVKNRLKNVDMSKKERHFERYLNEQTALVKVEAKTTSGNVYLKDKE